MTFGDSWKPINKGYEYSISLWINVDPSSCTESNPLKAKDSCHVFYLDGVFMLYFDG